MTDMELTYQDLYDDFKEFNIINSVHKLTMCFRTLKIKKFMCDDGTIHNEIINIYGLKHHGKKYELIKSLDEQTKQYCSNYEIREVKEFEAYDIEEGNKSIVCINEVDKQLIPVSNKKREFSRYFGIDEDLLPENFDEIMKNNIVMQDFILIFDPITINDELFLGLYENVVYKLMSFAEYNKKYAGKEKEK